MNPGISPETLAACGPNLEYEPDYLLLLARMAPVVEVQYGAFVGSTEAPDWAAMEGEARRLLALSQDIVLWVGVCRAATRLRRSAGLAAVLAECVEVLTAWPDAVHPQTWIDGVFDPVPRANALAQFCDPQGLIGEVRALVAAQPGASPEAPHRLSLKAAAADWVRLVDWSERHLGLEAPDLGAMSALLAPFASVVEPVEPSAPETTHPQVPATIVVAANLNSSTTTVTTTVTAPAAPAAPNSRADMQAQLAQARQWFEHHEPSSPVALLLLYAEHLVGKTYAELADAIPPESLRKWLILARPGGAAA